MPIYFAEDCSPEVKDFLRDIDTSKVNTIHFCSVSLAVDRIIDMDGRVFARQRTRYYKLRPAHFEKECSKCHQIKDKREFYKNSSKKDGLQSECKVCHDKMRYESRKKHFKNDASVAQR